MAGAYEFALSEWGYPARRLEAELTDELFVLYLDAATDRASRDFVSSVEAVRMGRIFASNATAYGAWIRERNAELGSPTQGLSGASLEQHVGVLRLSRPDLVRVMA